MNQWTEEYRAAVRAFIAEKGSKVQVAEKRYDWESDDEVSTYGWTDYEASQHVRSAEGKYPGGGCHWVVPEGARLYERSYSQFTDTFHSNENEVGINVRGCRCACGKYEDVILRWTGSLTDILHSILGMPTLRPEVEL